VRRRRTAPYRNDERQTKNEERRTKNEERRTKNEEPRTKNQEPRTKNVPKMTESSAQKLANVLIGAAVVGAAFYVVRTPSLRRLVWRIAVTAATGSLPIWLRQEIQHAWAESGRRPPDLHRPQSRAALE
jgi:predicted phage tail protein